MYQKNQALYKVFSGTGKMNCMYLFYSATSSKVSTEIPDNVTPSSLFSNVTTYGGILRVENIVPVEESAGVSFLASSDNGTAYGEQFADGVQVYAAALVVGSASKEDDLIFSVDQFTPITKAANAAVMVKAQVTL